MPASVRPVRTYKVIIHTHRVVLANVLLLHLLLGFHTHESGSGVLSHGLELALVGLFLAGSLALLVWAVHSSEYTPSRGLISVIFDSAMIAFAMVVLGDHMAALYILYPIILTGYSVVFGPRFLAKATAIVVASFFCAIVLDKWWQVNWLLAFSLVGYLVYHAWLLRRFIDDHNERQSLINELKKSHHLLIRSLAGDLRGPLNGVMGVSSLLSQSSLNSEQRSQVKTILASSRHMLKSLDDMLDVSYLDSGRLRSLPALFELHALLHDIRSTLAPVGEEHKGAFVLDIDPAVPNLVIGDASSLQQSLVRLLEGILQFSGDSPVTLAVRANQPSDHRCNVAFTIKTAHLNADWVLSNIPRMLIDGLVSVQGGTFEPGASCPSADASGVCPRLEVPFSLPPGNAPEAGPRTQNVIYMAGTQAAHHIMAKPMDILVADDDTTTLAVIKQLLTQVGHRVSVAHHGDEVLKQLEDRDFGALVIDLHMPGLSGIDLLKFIRNSVPNGTELPIIVVSADTSPGSISRVNAAGASVFVGKPVATSRLLDIIAEISAGRSVSKTAGAPQTLSVNGDLVLDRSPIDAMASLGLDSEQVSDFIDQCLSEADKCMRMLYISGSRADWDNLSRKAHQLSGIVGNIGLRRVSHLAESIHKLAKAELVDTWESRLNDLKTELSQGRVALRRLSQSI